MKKLFCTLLLAAMAICANAVPAKPGLKQTLTLTDGTTVVARLVGDEHGHYWLADDGKAYQALAGSDVFRAIDAQQVQQQARQKRAAVNERRMRRMAPRRVGQVGGITGKKKGLIILVNFSEKKFQESHNSALYKRIANEPGFPWSDASITGGNIGSMYDYFYDQSEGQFELTFDVVGPVQVTHNSSYYGGNDSEGNDKYPATMVIEALKKADASVNFADYDWDDDGEVEQVYVVYAGKGEADGGASTTIWPHEWSLSDASMYGDGDGSQTLDGVKVDTYACGGELDGQTGEIAGIGTMCHEFSHCLGYPDFYDTDYSGGQGMGFWDLMDSGSYNDGGYQPAGYTSYERWVAGWEEPVELTATTTVGAMKALQDGGGSYIVYNSGNRNEYFLLENRQHTGWDASLPGAGLLILHVDYSSSAWASNTPNDDPSHQRMTWIAADNKYQYTTSDGSKQYTFEGMANDPFPYSTVNAFGKSTTPAAKFYNKTADGTYYLDSSIEDITQNSDGTVAFRFVGKSNVAAPTFSVAAGRYTEAQTVTIRCATQGAAIHYTLDGSTPTDGSTRYTAPLTISETTTLKAVAILDGEASAVTTAQYVFGSALFYEGLSGYSSESDDSNVLSTGSSDLDFNGWAKLTKVYAGGTSNAYANGGCLKLGSSKDTGQLTTTAIGLTGNAMLTFYLKKYGSDSGKLNVSVSGATADVTSFTPMTDWTQCTVNISGAEGSVVITFATSSKRAYLDEIELTLAKPVDPVDPTTPSIANSYALVVDAATLASGDEVLIAYVNSNVHKAMSTIQNTNNRPAVDVTLNADGTLTPGDDAQVVTLEKDGDCYLFNVGSGYLCAASSTKNSLKTEETASDNARAAIRIASNGSATITFQGSYERNTMRYNPNNGSPLFSCYDSSSSTGSLPLIYRKVKTTEVLPGDADNDGQVTIADVMAIVSYILGQPAEGFREQAADIDGAEGVTIADAVAVLHIILDGQAD